MIGKLLKQQKLSLTLFRQLLQLTGLRFALPAIVSAQLFTNALTLLLHGSYDTPVIAMATETGNAPPIADWPDAI